MPPATPLSHDEKQHDEGKESASPSAATEDQPHGAGHHHQQHQQQRSSRHAAAVNLTVDVSDGVVAASSLVGVAVAASGSSPPCDEGELLSCMASAAVSSLITPMFHLAQCGTVDVSLEEEGRGHHAHQPPEHVPPGNTGSIHNSNVYAPPQQQQHVVNSNGNGGSSNGDDDHGDDDNNKAIRSSSSGSCSDAVAAVIPSSSQQRQNHDDDDDDDGMHHHCSPQWSSDATCFSCDISSPQNAATLGLDDRETVAPPAPPPQQQQHRLSGGSGTVGCLDCIQRWGSIDSLSSLCSTPTPSAPPGAVEGLMGFSNTTTGTDSNTNNAVVPSPNADHATQSALPSTPNGTNTGGRRSGRNVRHHPPSRVVIATVLPTSTSMASFGVQDGTTTTTATTTGTITNVIDVPMGTNGDMILDDPLISVLGITQMDVLGSASDLSASPNATTSPVTAVVVGSSSSGCCGYKPTFHSPYGSSSDVYQQFPHRLVSPVSSNNYNNAFPIPPSADSHSAAKYRTLIDVQEPGEVKRRAALRLRRKMQAFKEGIAQEEHNESERVKHQLESSENNTTTDDNVDDDDDVYSKAEPSYTRAATTQHDEEGEEGETEGHSQQKNASSISAETCNIITITTTGATTSNIKQDQQTVVCCEPRVLVEVGGAVVPPAAAAAAADVGSEIMCNVDQHHRLSASGDAPTPFRRASDSGRITTTTFLETGEGTDNASGCGSPPKHQASGGGGGVIHPRRPSHSPTSSSGATPRRWSLSQNNERPLGANNNNNNNTRTTSSGGGGAHSYSYATTTTKNTFPTATHRLAATSSPLSISQPMDAFSSVDEFVADTLMKFCVSGDEASVHQMGGGGGGSDEPLTDSERGTWTAGGSLLRSCGSNYSPSVGRGGAAGGEDSQPPSASGGPPVTISWNTNPTTTTTINTNWLSMGETSGSGSSAQVSPPPPSGLVVPTQLAAVQLSVKALSTWKASLSSSTNQQRPSPPHPTCPTSTSSSLSSSLKPV